MNPTREHELSPIFRILLRRNTIIFDKGILVQIINFFVVMIDVKYIAQTFLQERDYQKSTHRSLGSKKY